MNGTIESTTTDWRGDTLTAALISSDAEILVGDTSDFDEDGGWLTIADSAALAYLSVDEDANTVTLAAPVGAAHEAGEPVVIWDPTAPPTGAKVVEYLASVMTDRGPVDAVIPHEMIPLAGVDKLDGASVTLAESDDGEWFVDRILAREARIDPASIGSELFQAYLASDGGRAGGLNIPNASDTDIGDWTVTAYDPNAFDYDGAGRLTLKVPGSYLSVVTVTWVSNTGARRETVMTTTTLGVDNEEVRIPLNPDTVSGSAAHQVTLLQRTTAPDVQLRALAFQNTGASLGLNGNSAGTRTNWRVLRLR